MGSSTSKVAKGASRSFPKSALPPSAGVTFPPPPISFPPPPSSRPTPPPPPSSDPSSPSQPPPKNALGSISSSGQHGATKSKTEAILRDGSDPTLLSRLSEIGQVEIPANSAYDAPPASASPFTPLFHSRATDRISFPTFTGLDPDPTPDQLQNRLTSSELVELLYRRHHVRTGPDVQALAEEFHTDVKVLEEDLGRYLCVVRPEWGLEVLVSEPKQTLNQRTKHEDTSSSDHAKMRAATKRTAESGGNDLRLGAEMGRANSGKTDFKGELIQDTDAMRVLARWRDPILPLGITQTLRDQLEREQIEREEREKVEMERRAVEQRAREAWEKQEKEKRSAKMRKRIGDADI